jgi:hypothetical protein
MKGDDAHRVLVRMIKVLAFTLAVLAAYRAMGFLLPGGY